MNFFLIVAWLLNIPYRRIFRTSGVTSASKLISCVSSLCLLWRIPRLRNGIYFLTRKIATCHDSLTSLYLSWHGSWFGRGCRTDGCVPFDRFRQCDSWWTWWSWLILCLAMALSPSTQRTISYPIVSTVAHTKKCVHSRKNQPRTVVLIHPS